MVSNSCADPLFVQALFDNQPPDSELRAAVAAVVEVPTAAPQREEAALLLGKKLMVGPAPSAQTHTSLAP